MTDSKENLNDTKYLLEDTYYKNTNDLDEINIKNNTLLNNTQLLLEDKSSILYDISFENINKNQIKKEQINNNFEKEQKNVEENSIKDILIKDTNINNDEEKEKKKDEQEIIKQQNILLNNQSTHLEELLYLSYADIPHNNKNINDNCIHGNKNKQIYLGVLFPTEKIIKTINYKNDDTKKIICFNITNCNNNKTNDEQYFKLLIDKNKNYFNLQSKEEINIKISLEAPFVKKKKQLRCDIQIIDINNCLIDILSIFAYIEIPKLCVMKYIKNDLNIKENKIPFIQIKLNTKDANNIYKFRIPMKNLSIKDINMNFFLISNPKDINNKDNDYEIFFENDKMVIFPSLDINYCDIILNIKAKDDLIKEKNMKIKKVLKANITDTKINYFFCLEILIVNNNKNLNNI